MDDRILYRDLSYKIVGLAMQAHTELGYGFLEKVYENALMILFEENGIWGTTAGTDKSAIPWHGDGMVIGDYIADIVVEDSVILELKAAEKIAEIHKAQTLNYLKATNFRLPLLLNFGKRKLEYERLVL